MRMCGRSTSISRTSRAEREGRSPLTAPEMEDLLRRLAPQVLGAVVRRYGNFDLAEDATQEALAAAAVRWPEDGLPDNPRGWLITVASRRLTDLLRSDSARRRREETVAGWALTERGAAGADERRSGDPDDTVVLLFLCCHPSLSVASQIALTLRAVGGLNTAEIARALLGSEQTVTRRITRAKQSIKDSGVPFALPSHDEMGGRLEAVLRGLLLDIQRGVRQHGRNGAGPSRPGRGGDPPRPGAPPGGARGPRGGWVAGANAPRACAAPRPYRTRRVAHPNGGARPWPVGPGRHRGGDRAHHRRPSPRADRAVPAPGSDRRHPR